MRILKSHIISNLRDRVICVRQLGHSAVHFGFQDELLQCHPGALVEEGGEVFVVVAEITGEFGDFEGLAAVVLDVADDVLQDLCPLRFGSVGAVEGALAVDFAENSGSQAVVEERVVETQGSVLELLHEDDDAVRGRKAFPGAGCITFRGSWMEAGRERGPQGGRRMAVQHETHPEPIRRSGQKER